MTQYDAQSTPYCIPKLPLETQVLTERRLRSLHLLPDSGPDVISKFIEIKELRNFSLVKASCCLYPHPSCSPFF
jgi:hypothetical protein